MWVKPSYGLDYNPNILELKFLSLVVGVIGSLPPYRDLVAVLRCFVTMAVT